MFAALTAAVVLQSGPVLLRVKPTKGIAYDYLISFAITAEGGAMSAKIPLRDTYKGTAGKNHLWEVKFLKPTFVGTGGFEAYAKSAAEDFSDMTLLYERKPTFVPVSATIGKTKMSMSVEKDGTSDIIFPEKAVRVGDTWPGKIQAGNSMLDMTYKYLGVSKEKGLATWKVEGTPKGKDIKVLRPYVWQIDQRDGRTISASGEIDAKFNGITAKMGFSISQTRRGQAK